MQLQGEIKAVIFASQDTGYTVLDMRCEDSVFTVVGIFPPVSEGMNIRVEGKFQTRTTYGKQFCAEKVWVSAPSKLEGIKKFLGSGLISGLGPVTAQSIVDTFGVDSLEMMKYPMELAKVRGISLKRATEFGMNYAKVQKMQDAVMFLQNLGISVNMSLRIYRTYDVKTVDNVRKNPYMLVDDVDGIGFATADRIAGELGIEKDSDYRICAAITYLLKEAATKSGHNYLPENELLGSAIVFRKIRAMLGNNFRAGVSGGRRHRPWHRRRLESGQSALGRSRIRGGNCLFSALAVPVRPDRLHGLLHSVQYPRSRRAAVRFGRNACLGGLLSGCPAGLQRHRVLFLVCPVRLHVLRNHGAGAEIPRNILSGGIHFPADSRRRCLLHHELRRAGGNGTIRPSGNVHRRHRRYHGRGHSAGLHHIPALLRLEAEKAVCINGIAHLTARE